MKFGFMPQFGEDLFSEIEFAKKHFDFFELTLQDDLFIYTQEYIVKIKEALGNFEILGHLHWEIDLSEQNIKFNQINKNIEIFKKLKINKLTVHPSVNKTLTLDKLRENNIKNLTKITDICKDNKILLCIENISEAPFNKAEEMEYLIKHIPNSNITFDVGHALKISEEEFNNFLKLENIKHIHLHNVIEDKDHIFFYKKENLLNRLDKLKNALNLDTITLEMFANIKNDKFHYKISKEERHKLLLKQVAWINLFKNSYQNLE
ncbi:MAG: TIM barrel protein, partial [Candidatus Micrarchaeia archaeon]